MTYAQIKAELKKIKKEFDREELKELESLADSEYTSVSSSDIEQELNFN